MSREQRQTFEPIEHYERLIKLREDPPTAPAGNDPDIWSDLLM
jgi:hypothetical protein